MRQRIFREHDPGRGVSIATLAHEYGRGSRVPPHAHGSDQLVYASRGIMEVASGQNLWMIPPHFLLWIPARIPHRIRMPEPVSMRTLYLRPGLTRLPAACTVLHVSPLLRELIFEIVRAGQLRVRDRVACLLRDLLVVHLERASPMPAGVTMPTDPRALAVARLVVEHPGRHSPLAAMCRAAGVGVRTLQRVFRRDIGINFESWRRQVRLMKAIELLFSGYSVKEAAYTVGYRQATAFVVLFRATFGATPKAWISTLNRING
jgi:AraC-like DNA-binding protein